MSRRRTIAEKRETPIPPDPYLDVAPKHIWITDDIGNYVIVFSNSGWITT